MKTVSLRYFGAVRESLGIFSENFSTNAITLGDCWDELQARNSIYSKSLSKNNAVRAALNHVIVDDDAQIMDGDEIAFFPPVTGG